MTEILHVGHSPDPDDAFMFYALAEGHVRLPGYEVRHVMEDIESLNRRALLGELESTAISAAIYPRVAKEYQILASGASVGRDYGPIVVSRLHGSMDELAGKRIAVPGRHTTAFLVLRLRLRAFQPVETPFDRVAEAVWAGEADAGVLIHEGQMTYPKLGLRKLLDLGSWWQAETGLPLPLGLDVVRRDLGGAFARSFGRALRESIAYAFAHEDEALAYAMGFGRGIDVDTCRAFVRRYVNDDTLDLGEEGRRALETLYGWAAEDGLIEKAVDVDLAG